MRGEIVYVIQEVGPVWATHTASIQALTASLSPESQESAHSALLSILERWKTVVRIKDEGLYSFTNQTRTEAFWRILFIDRYRCWVNAYNFDIRRFPPVLDREMIDRIFKSLNVYPSFPPESLNDEVCWIWYLQQEATETYFAASVNLHCNDLRIFRTETGYIGLCHPGAHPGDQTVVLLGASVSVILREYPEGHILIGQRFVPVKFSQNKVVTGENQTKILADLVPI